MLSCNFTSGKISIYIMVALMREYISTYLLHTILVRRLLLNKFFTYGDDFRLHIYTVVWKQFNSRVIKADVINTVDARTNLIWSQICII